MNQEKLYELAQDIKEEQLLRKDFEYALRRFDETHGNDCGLSEATSLIENATHYLSLYGWDITYDELKDSF